MGQGQDYLRKMYNFTYFNMLIPCMLLQIINEVKVTHQGKGHIKVKVLCMWLWFIIKVKVTHQGQGM